jgi:curved DNA-binding protein CbpA
MVDRPPFDPYLVLGLSREATALQVARAHRRLAKQHHPDLDPDPERVSRMRRINEAWQILSIPERRAAYDRDHPAAGMSRTGHWTATRHSVKTAQPTTTGSWATWRATAAETRAAPRTVRQPGEHPIPATRRPPPRILPPRTVHDSGWLALAIAITFVVLLLTAIFVGRALA